MWHRHVTSIATYTVIDQQCTGMFTGVVTSKFRFHKDKSKIRGQPRNKKILLGASRRDKD